MSSKEYFINAEVGDKVFSLNYGSGHISRIDTGYLKFYPINVKFTDGVTDGFTLDGKLNTDDYGQTLFYGSEYPFSDDMLPPEPVRTIVINGIEIPDISYHDGIPDDVKYCIIPLVGSERLTRVIPASEIHTPSFAYPNTLIGDKAARLHSKALRKTK